MTAEFDYGEAKTVLASVLLGTGLDLAGATGVAQLQIERLAQELLVTVPFFRAPPCDDDELVARSLITAMLGGMADESTGVLESIDNPYGAIMVLAGLVGAMAGHMAEAEQVPVHVVWQRVCASFEQDGGT